MASGPELRATRVAQNLMQSYGYDGFVRLLELFRQNVSGSEIATEFSVSKQRVHQWQGALGERIVMFRVRPEVEQLLGVVSSMRTTV